MVNRHLWYLLSSKPFIIVCSFCLRVQFVPTLNCFVRIALDLFKTAYLVHCRTQVKWLFIKVKILEKSSYFTMKQHLCRLHSRSFFSRKMWIICEWNWIESSILNCLLFISCQKPGWDYLYKKGFLKGSSSHSFSKFSKMPQVFI